MTLNAMTTSVGIVDAPRQTDYYIRVSTIVPARRGDFSSGRTSQLRSSVITTAPSLDLDPHAQDVVYRTLL